MYVVYTIGVFDMFHIGHLNFLLNAKKLGDTLIVGIQSDNSTKKTKRCPVIPEEERREIVSNIACVDGVLLYEDTNQIPILEKIRPAIFAIGPEYNTNPYYTKIEEYCAGCDIQIVVVERTANISTTRLIQKCFEKKKELQQTATSFWQSALRYPSYATSIEKRRKYELKYLYPLIQDKKSILDLGCGDGSLLTKLYNKWNTPVFKYKKWYAYDFSQSLLDTIPDTILLDKQCYNILQPTTLPKTDLVILAGVLPFIFDNADVVKLFSHMNSSVLYVRTPCSMKKDEIINKWSTDLSKEYAAIYRTVTNTKALLSSCWDIKDTGRIYPDCLESKYNTKQYYFLCMKKI